MTKLRQYLATAAITTLALAAGDLAASAQSLTNGPNGAEPNRLASKIPGGSMGKAPSRAVLRPGYGRHARGTGVRYGRAAARRPLVVRRAAPPVVVAAPVATGPGALVTGPLGFGSALVNLPFRGLNAVFPATGDVATNPLVLIGAPLHAIGDIVQVPFRIVGAPFGGTTIATD